MTTLWAQKGWVTWRSVLRPRGRGAVGSRSRSHAGAAEGIGTGGVVPRATGTWTVGVANPGGANWKIGPVPDSDEKNEIKTNNARAPLSSIFGLFYLFDRRLRAGSAPVRPGDRDVPQALPGVPVSRRASRKSPRSHGEKARYSAGEWPRGD